MKNNKIRISTALSLLLLAIISIVASSCTKANEMGKLRGQWQLMTIERPDAEIVVVDSPRRYMSFDQGLLQLTTSNDKEVFHPQYIAEVAGEEPNLIFNFPYDTYPSAMEIITDWGIDTNPANVKVITLDSKSLVLDVDGNLLTLRRF